MNTKKGAINVHNIDPNDTYLELRTTITQIVKVIIERYGLIARIAPAVVIIPLPPIHLVLLLSFICIMYLMGKQWPIVANNPAMYIKQYIE